MTVTVRGAAIASVGFINFHPFVSNRRPLQCYHMPPTMHFNQPEEQSDSWAFSITAPLVYRTTRFLKVVDIQHYQE
jgi:hypothetical protein